jgi:hypothetical protein
VTAKCGAPACILQPRTTALWDSPNLIENLALEQCAAGDTLLHAGWAVLT